MLLLLPLLLVLEVPCRDRPLPTPAASGLLNTFAIRPSSEGVVSTAGLPLALPVVKAVATGGLPAADSFGVPLPDLGVWPRGVGALLRRLFFFNPLLPRTLRPPLPTCEALLRRRECCCC